MSVTEITISNQCAFKYRGIILFFYRHAQESNYHIKNRLFRYYGAEERT